MKYKIFEFEIRETCVPDGYYTSTEYRNILKDLKMPFEFEDTHPNESSAMAEICKWSEELKNKNLTILPIISINWEGDIVE